MAPMGIDPATFRFVAQCLNLLRHHVPTSGNRRHAFLSSALEETLRCLSFAPRKQSLITVKSEAGGPQRRLWRIDGEKISCSCRESNTVHASRISHCQALSAEINSMLHKVFIYVSLHSHSLEKLILFLFVANAMYNNPNYCVFQSRCGSVLLCAFLVKKFWMWKVEDCANVLPLCDVSETWCVYRFGVEFLWKESEVCSLYFTEFVLQNAIMLTEKWFYMSRT